MITKYDELFCHQAVSTFDTPGTSAREWTERAWMQVHHLNGAAHLATGFGYYPNRNVMDAFACFTIADRTHYIVRASRELRPEIDVCTVGPFRYDVVEALRRARFVLDENPYGLSFDIEADGVSPLYEEPAQRQISRGRLKEDIKRMVQCGRPRGWIKADAQTFQLDQTAWVCERDRSWGVRVAGADFVESGVQPPEIYDGQLFNFVIMQFPDWGASFHIREIWDDAASLARRWHFGGGVFYPYGRSERPIELECVEHYYEFNDERPEQQRRFAGGRVVMTAIDGTTREVAIRPISICYQAPGGYGLPYKEFIHGLWMGALWMDGHRLDVTDPSVMREIWGYVDYGSEFRCGADVGYGTTELMVVGKYPRYGYQGY
ncbi:MAG: hypothetical protein A3J75_04760 [Acidobacteria bacterium RBG_16_68_9]|nr:MAG: hypothetical protein A3J75_04760 [Acidobacteria bacterium RBG_16_68_9]